MKEGTRVGIKEHSPVFGGKSGVVMFLSHGVCVVYIDGIGERGFCYWEVRTLPILDGQAAKPKQ